MHIVTRAQGASADLALRATRTGQAVAISIADRVANLGPGVRPGLLARAYGFQLGVVRILWDDPAEIVDGTYALSEQLVGLHRQFAQRLLETVDIRPADIA
jgi:hypothetical protein